MLRDFLSSPLLLDFTPQAGETYTFSHKLTEPEIGSWLARALLNEERLLGIRLVRREQDKTVYQVYEAEASPCVIRLFLEKSTGKLIHGVKNHFVFTRLFHKSLALKSAEDSFWQGWKEALDGETRPVADLWEGIDTE
jgi:hypothetical protein